jgi:hypothetical protein
MRAAEVVRSEAAQARKRERDRVYNAARTGGNTAAAARWRAQKRQWWRERRSKRPVTVRVAP